jgi:hypothetical protein
VIVGDVLDNTTATKSVGRENACDTAPTGTSIEETRLCSMTTTVTDFRPVLAYLTGSCEVHRPDLDSLISNLDANS